MGDILLDAAYIAALPLVAFEFESITDIITGVGETFLGSIETLAFSIPDIFDGIVTLIEFSLSNLFCFIKILGNFKSCIFYYILDIIGQLMYLPIRITLWAVKQFLKVNVYPLEQKIWEYIDLADCALHKFTGFYLTHYPPNVIDDCYNCCRVKTSVLYQKGQQINDDINKYAPDLLWPGIKNIEKGAQKFMNPFG